VTKVKICGITNLEDALIATEVGADLLGFIFYEPSPRYIAPEMVREIVSVVSSQWSVASSQTSKATDNRQQTTDSARPLFVGVFVNHSLETVASLLDFCQLDAAQLHGEESPEFVNYLGGRAYKALQPQSQEEAEALIKKYQPSSLPTFQPSNLPTLLLDAYHPHLYGGTGQVADWSLAANIARRYPLMLAGSLTVENVTEAIRVVRPWGVDVSSGVEKEKGKKDHSKIKAFVEAAKNLRRKM
jgi:phosphoribosylanthranilate isomerase